MHVIKYIMYHLIYKFTCFKLNVRDREIFKISFIWNFLYLLFLSLPGAVHRITLSTTVNGSWNPRDQLATQRMLEVRGSSRNRLRQISPGVYHDWCCSVAFCSTSMNNDSPSDEDPVSKGSVFPRRWENAHVLCVHEEFLYKTSMRFYLIW